jgi:DNA-directed RNA polymerase subunit RPC12/RpoP
MAEKLMADRPLREQALLEVLELSRRGDTLGCSALWLAIFIKSGKTECWQDATWGLATVKVHESLAWAKKVIALGYTRKMIVDNARDGLLLSNPPSFGELIAALGLDEQNDLQKEVAAISDEQLQAFQFLLTEVRATLLLAENTDPEKLARLKLRVDLARLRRALLERAEPLTKATAGSPVSRGSVGRGDNPVPGTSDTPGGQEHVPEPDARRTVTPEPVKPSASQQVSAQADVVTTKSSEYKCKKCGASLAKAGDMDLKKIIETWAVIGPHMLDVVEVQCSKCGNRTTAGVLARQ